MIVQACGTIINGTTQEVEIKSTPSNASVIINGVNYGSTPLLVNLQRKESHRVSIELDGYQTFETYFIRDTSDWVWGNIALGGLIGLIVDASTGGLYKLTPEQIEAELRSFQINSITSEKGLSLLVVLEADSDWKKIGSINSKN